MPEAGKALIQVVQQPLVAVCQAVRLLFRLGVRVEVRQAGQVPAGEVECGLALRGRRRRLAAGGLVLRQERRVGLVQLGPFLGRGVLVHVRLDRGRQLRREVVIGGCRTGQLVQGLARDFHPDPDPVHVLEAFEVNVQGAQHGGVRPG
jgi:hypothetical protein